MPVVRHLLREPITLSQAKDREVNIIHQLGYLSQQQKFFEFIRTSHGLIIDRVAHHLRVSRNKCHVDSDNWMNGSFNLCVPVRVEGFGRVIARFPLPYRVGDSFHPENGVEKVRCEAGTYAWMQQNCPGVPIPRLHGFSLRPGVAFTALDNLPLLNRLLYLIKRWFSSLFRRESPSQFVRDDYSKGDHLGPYLIIDFIEDSNMLSDSWTTLNSRKDLRTNLFRDIAKVMLAMSKFNISKIGSFIIDDHGYLRLANRPLTLMLHDLENEHIAVDMPKHQTIASVDSYVNCLLGCHDNRLCSQPNAVKSAADCVSQMTALALMRTVRPHFFNRQLNEGPFIFCLNDLHPSNIFVDKDWHIKCLVDLEWASSLPIEFMRPPIWLTGQAVDEINVRDFNSLRQEFMDIFEEEERRYPTEYRMQRSSIMTECWNLGAFWYCTALRSPTGLHSVFYDHILPSYSEKHAQDPNFFLTISRYWTRGTSEFIKSRLEAKAIYDSKLRDMFVESRDTQ